MLVQEIFNIVKEYHVDKNRFISFTVTFKMQSPIALTHPYINFDGLIAHLLLRKLLGTSYGDLPTNLPLDFYNHLQLPIARLSYGSNFIYQSSISLFDNERLYLTTLYKRFDDKHLSQLKTRKKKIDLNRGTLKSYAMKLPYRPCQQVRFHVKGDIDLIRELLDGLPGLGKKTSVGYGFINSFSITSTKENKSIIDKNGLAMRPIPCSFLDDRLQYEKAVLAFKFPYWAKTSIALCCVPGEKIRLKSTISIN